MKNHLRLLLSLLAVLVAACAPLAPRPPSAPEIDPAFFDELHAAGLTPVVDELGAPDRALRMTASAAVDPQPGLRWYVYDLPAGDVGSINIDWLTRNGAAINISASTFLRDGDGDGKPDHDGILFRGKGIDVTNIRCTSWDGFTVAVLRGRYKVRFEDCTIYSGYDRGVAFGEQNIDGDRRPDGSLIWGTQRLTAPEFELQLENVRGVVEAPPKYGASGGSVTAAGQGYKNGDVVTIVGGNGRATKLKLSTTRNTQTGAEVVTSVAVVPGENGTYTTAPPSPSTVTGGSGQGLTVWLSWRRAKWMWFAYNADLLATNVRTEAGEAVEHGYYWHGFAQRGATLTGCYTESGAEGFKTRPDKSEVAYWGGGSSIVLRDCEFRYWFRRHSWRGGAAIVIQGGASHFFAERCFFYSGEALTGSGEGVEVAWNERSKAIMISSEGDAYGHGSKDSTFGNGFVVIRQCAAVGGSLVDWRNTIVRVARNSGSQLAARGFLMESSGIYGPKLVVQLGDMPSGRAVIRGCNTGSINAYCRNVLGMDSSIEATFPTSQRRVPLSEGIVR